MKAFEVIYDKNIPNSKKFGVYIKARRKDLNISLKEFAIALNLAPAYISDIENGNRTAPLNYLEQIAMILHIDNLELDYFYDLAGWTHSNWPDINEYLAKTPNARKALRLAKAKNLSDEVLSEIINSIAKEKVQENADELTQ